MSSKGKPLPEMEPRFVWPILLAVWSAALFGGATPAAKTLLPYLSPWQLAGLLYLGAALGVSPALIARRHDGVRRLRTARSVSRLAGAVLLGGVVAPLLFLFALRYASAGSVALWLNFEAAATALLGAVVFREPLGTRGWFGLAGVVAADSLLVRGEGTPGGIAALAVAAACTCWALDNHWTALVDELSPMEVAFWKGAIAGSINLALGLAMGPCHLPWGPSWRPWPSERWATAAASECTLRLPKPSERRVPNCSSAARPFSVFCSR